VNQDCGGQRTTTEASRVAAKLRNWVRRKRGNLLRATAATVAFMGFKHLVLTQDGPLAANVIGGSLFWCLMFFTFEHLLDSRIPPVEEAGGECVRRCREDD